MEAGGGKIDARRLMAAEAAGRKAGGGGARARNIFNCDYSHPSLLYITGRSTCRRDSQIRLGGGGEGRRIARKMLASFTEAAIGPFKTAAMRHRNNPPANH